MCGQEVSATGGENDVTSKADASRFRMEGSENCSDGRDSFQGVKMECHWEYGWREMNYEK